MDKIITLILFVLLSQNVLAQDITEQEKAEVIAVCILGEARGEFMKYGFESLLAIAEGIRNRDTLNGVYGCRYNPTIEELQYMDSNGTLKGAFLAYTMAFNGLTDRIGGANHWCSITVDRSWCDEMEKSESFEFKTQIGHHRFYKELRQ